MCDCRNGTLCRICLAVPVATTTAGFFSGCAVLPMFTAAASSFIASSIARVIDYGMTGAEDMASDVPPGPSACVRVTLPVASSCITATALGANPHATLATCAVTTSVTAVNERLIRSGFFSQNAAQAPEVEEMNDGLGLQ